MILKGRHWQVAVYDVTVAAAAAAVNVIQVNSVALVNEIKIKLCMTSSTTWSRRPVTSSQRSGAPTRMSFLTASTETRTGTRKLGENILARLDRGLKKSGHYIQVGKWS